MKRLYYTNQTVDRKLAREVELKIEDQTGLELRNPFYDDEAKEVRSLDSTGVTHLSHDEIVGMDLRKIRECDGILAYLTNDRNIGSCMEIAIAAHSWGMKVYVIATVPYIHSHPWIQHFATKLFKTSYEFIRYAQENMDHSKKYVEEKYKTKKGKPKAKWPFLPKWI